MLTLLVAAAKAAGISLSLELLGDVEALTTLGLKVAWADAKWEIAKKRNADDADILGGNVQELEQMFLNLMASIEQKYPAELGAAVKGILQTMGVKV